MTGGRYTKSWFLWI